MDYKLEDLIDIKAFQELQDRLNEIYTFPSAIIGNDGRILTATAWQDICVKFHRACPVSAAECVKSDRYILDHLQEAAPAVSYRCPHGMIDSAVPIIIEGRHLGNFFTGQIFLEPPDMDFFRSQAAKYGFDERAYLEAVAKVPVWSREKLDKYISFIKSFTELLAGAGLKNFKEIEANKKIRDNETKFRLIFENSHDAIGISKNGMNVFMNRAYLDLFGYENPEEIAGRPITEQIAPEARAFIAENVRKRSAGEYVPKRYETVGLKKSGESFEFDVTVDTYSLGGETYTIAIIRDVSERKKFENELRAAKEKAEYNEERYGLMILNSPDLIMLQDADGTVTYMSPQVEKVIGHSTRSFEGKGFPAFIHDEDRPAAFNAFQKAMAGENIIDFEYRFFSENGDTLWLSHTARPVVKNGRVVSVQSNIRNITEKKRTENELIIERNNAEEASRAKSVFLANMSHELRTPLNGIIGFSNLLAGSRLSGEQAEFNEMVTDSALHLLSLINDLLDYSKLEARKIRLEKKEFDLVETIRSSAKFIDAALREKGLRLFLEIDPEIKFPLFGDQLRVRQILINLLTNAVKFTPSGKIVLKAALAAIAPGSCRVKMSIADEGIGIPADRLGEVFEMFHQLEDHSTKRHGGAGIGLSIVKGLAELMGGSVSVKSEPGKGSEFTVELPFDISKSPATSGVNYAKAVAPLDAGAENPVEILLAEDDEMSCFFIAALAERFNWKLSVARNGLEAVALYQSRTFDAVIMDGQMPEMNGFEAAREIRRIEKTGSGAKRIPIIALTAYAMPEDRDKFIAAGMDDYLTKPLTDSSLLFEKIRELIGKNS